MHVTLAPDSDSIKVLNQKFTNTFKQIEKDIEQKDLEIKKLKEKLISLEELDYENKFTTFKMDLESKKITN